MDISISDDTCMYRHNLFCSSSISYMLIISDDSDFSSFLMTQVVLLLSIVDSGGPCGLQSDLLNVLAGKC